MSVLNGLKIVEMSAIGPVPLAGMLLSDMGAEVVRQVKPNDPFAIPNDVCHRGKLSLELDIKTEQGQQQAKQLIEKADVVIEGSRPGVMERLGLGPEQFEQANPKLIYGRMTGWGQTGPLAQTAGHDINYIALTGALHAIGRESENPVPPLNLVGDYGGGSMFLVMGILAALYERQTSGKGQVIDAAITEGTANLMSIFYSMNQVGMWSQNRASNMLDSAAPYYDTYQTSDNKFIAIGAIEPKFYAELVEKMELGLELFAEQNNQEKWQQQKQQIARVVKTKTQDEWLEIFKGSDACVSPVLDFKQANKHPQMQHRQAYQEIGERVEPMPAPKFSRTPSSASKERSVSFTKLSRVWGLSTE